MNIKEIGILGLEKKKTLIISNTAATTIKTPITRTMVYEIQSWRTGRESDHTEVAARVISIYKKK